MGPGMIHHAAQIVDTIDMTIRLRLGRCVRYLLYCFTDNFYQRYCIHFFLQEVFYFPLTPRLEALLSTEAFRHLLRHEFTRPKQEGLISDVYDTPAWREFVNDLKDGELRIIMQYCVDGIPAFAADTKTLKPAEFILLSLPPSLRGKPKNILLHMLLPGDLKGQSQKKYYDFAAIYELDELFNRGIDGVKVRVFGASMDTKGREELLGMQACQAYQSCWACTHAWTPGSLVKRKQCIFDGFRRFLKPGSRGRQKTFVYKGGKYEFRNVSVRPQPRYRDEQFVRVAVSLATTSQPFCGHKYVPLMAKWLSFNWYRFGIPEPMHGN